MGAAPDSHILFFFAMSRTQLEEDIARLKKNRAFNPPSATHFGEDGVVMQEGNVEHSWRQSCYEDQHQLETII